MSKVGEYFREQQELGIIPTEDEMIQEPTDEELAKIENEVNKRSIEDWEHLGHSQLLQTVTFYFEKSLVYILKNRYITM